jgi:nitrogen-specific signal transduction histidine kinase
VPNRDFLLPFSGFGLLHALSGVHGGAKMAQTKQELVRELNHEIHSPLAAIRNALYLAAVRSSDPATLRYLELADAEISRIAGVLRKVNQTNENKRVQLLVPSILPVTAH